MFSLPKSLLLGSPRWSTLSRRDGVQTRAVLAARLVKICLRFLSVPRQMVRAEMPGPTPCRRRGPLTLCDALDALGLWPSWDRQSVDSFQSVKGAARPYRLLVIAPVAIAPEDAQPAGNQHPQPSPTIARSFCRQHSDPCDNSPDLLAARIRKRPTRLPAALGSSSPPAGMLGPLGVTAGHAGAGPWRTARRRRPDRPLPCRYRFFFWVVSNMLSVNPSARGSADPARSWAASSYQRRAGSAPPERRARQGYRI